MKNLIRKVKKLFSGNAFDLVTCVYILTTLIFILVGIVCNKFKDENFVSGYTKLLSLFIAYLSLKYAIESSTISQHCSLPYLSLTSKMADTKGMFVICVENVGNGDLYKLKMDEYSRNILNNVGTIESKNYLFDTINMHAKKKDEYKLILQNQNITNKKINLTFFFDDKEGNYYKQTISVCCDEDGIYFMSNQPKCRKRKDK